MSKRARTIRHNIVVGIFHPGQVEMPNKIEGDVLID